ncbi:hypothetical protein [Chryseobacterium sp. MMS23-Vi53]|uniref:hypothetical protein n=1 Tax=Chryseobacterium sp. MMS23-Vi53 TaxID=3386644 RepID=UPI0039EC2688
MRKRLLITGMLSVASLAFAQVGINTQQAETTFDIVAKDSKGTSRVPEGLLIPRVDRERAQSMFGVPISTLIYINDISTGSAAGIAANVDEVGYYYYNGTVWTKIAEGSSNNIHVYNSNGTITSNRIVSLEDKGFSFNGTRNNGFAVNKVGDNPSSVISADMENARVGIGTSTPQAKLDIRTSTNAYGLQHSDDNIRLRSWINEKEAFFGNITNHGLSLMTNNRGRLYIANDGNVGIGTKTPNNRLDLGYDAADTVNDPSGKKLAIFNNLAGDSFYGFGISSYALQFHSGSKKDDAPAMVLKGNTVDNSGKLGIGTTEPSERLHVAGKVRIEDGTQGANKVLVSDVNGVGSWKDLPGATGVNIYNGDGTITGNRTITMLDRHLTFNTGTGGLSVNGNTNGLTRANFTNQNTGTSSRSDINIGTPNNNIYLGVDTGGAIFGAGKKSYIDNRSEGSLFIGNQGIAKMTLDKSGNIGIGTTTPNAAAVLDVSSTTQGFLPPRLTTAQRNAIANRPPGLMVYNTDTNCLNFWNSAEWVSTCSSTSVPPSQGTIETLNCSGASHNGALVMESSASGVSSVISYTGGNGLSHNGQSVSSTGVTGLTATLSSGSFANGNGTVTYTITGTPSSVGTASFAINIGGKACTITRTVTEPEPPTGASFLCTPNSYFISAFDRNNPTVNATVNGKQVTVTYSNFTNSTYPMSNPATWQVNNCGIGTVPTGGMMMGTTAGGASSRLTIKFSRPVSNFRIDQLVTSYGEKYTYKFKRNGVQVTPVLRIWSDCLSNYQFENALTNGIYITNVVNSPAPTMHSGVKYNFEKVWFDEIELVATSTLQTYNGSIFSACIGSVL